MSQHLRPGMSSFGRCSRRTTTHNKATIAEIIQTLERHFGIMFYVSTKKRNQDRYNFVFKENAGLEEVLEVMQVVVGQFDYRLKDNACHIIW